MEISVVVPVYASSTTLPLLARRIEITLAHGGEYEIIMVDDGSTDDTWQVLSGLARNNPRIRALRLGRNFGQHNALLAGVRAAKYSVVVTIDDDLQNPPEEIPRLVEALNTSGLDVVYGVPYEVAQSLTRRIASSIGWWEGPS